ncbi:hypothetical protein Tco_1374702, partial [Tanacetum coccineum]
YGYIKNHKKTVKNRQARTRESVEYKAEARKVKPQSKSAKKSQTMVKHTRDVGFALDPLTELAQHVTSKNDMLAILRCPQCDPTAIKLDQKIEMNEGYGLRIGEQGKRVWKLHQMPIKRVSIFTHTHT